MLKVLIVSDKKYFLFEGCYYSYGGTPKEFNALSGIFHLDIMVPVKNTNVLPSGYESLLPSINIIPYPPFDYFCGMPSLPQMWKTLHKVKIVCSENHYDVVVGKGPREMGMVAVLAAHSFSIPSIFHYSYDWVPNLGGSEASVSQKIVLAPYRFAVWTFRKWFMKKIAHKASLVATVSEEFKGHLASVCDIDRNSIALLKTTFTTSNRYFQILEYPFDGPNRVLYVGRLDSNKNVVTLLRAISILKLEKNIEVSLIVAGTGVEEKNLKTEAINLDIASDVEFLGYVSNDSVPDLLEKTTCLVLPSYSETLGKVLIEAQSAGRVAVGSNVGGIPGVILNGSTGYLFNPSDAMELAEVLAKVLLNRVKSNQMGREGRERMKEYSTENILNVWMTELAAVSTKNREEAQ